MDNPTAATWRPARCKDAGVDVVFTLSGGHIFPLYDGCVTAGIRLVDTRHEQTAGFAAEGWAKVTRQVGVAALTAGPGVTNGLSAITSAFFCGSPMVVIGGRAPAARWGSGSLQEVDHVPIVAEVTKRAATAAKTDDIYPEIAAVAGHGRRPRLAVRASSTSPSTSSLTGPRPMRTANLGP